MSKEIAFLTNIFIHLTFAAFFTPKVRLLLYFFPFKTDFSSTGIDFSVGILLWNQHKVLIYFLPFYHWNFWIATWIKSDMEILMGAIKKKKPMHVKKNFHLKTQGYHSNFKAEVSEKIISCWGFDTLYQTIIINGKSKQLRQHMF